MKNIWKSLLLAAVCVGAFTSCEDVPAPYVIPSQSSSGSSTDASAIFTQSFATSLGQFQTSSSNGSIAWTNDYSSAVVTGFKDFDGDGQKENQAGETYLVSPAIDLSEIDSAYVNISQAINYAKSTIAEDHKLLISTDFAGDATAATWTEIPLSTEGLGSSFTFLEQNIQLPQAYMGQTIYLALKHIAHEDYSSTWEVKNLKVCTGTAPSNDGPVIENGVGSGTKDDPYDVPTTLKLIAAGAPASKIYTKGVVVSVDEGSFDSKYGSLIYYISNDGSTTDQLEVYRGYGLGGAKFTSASDLKQGDEVIVYGQVVYYNNKTPEFTQGSQLYKLNDQIADTGEETSQEDAIFSQSFATDFGQFQGVSEAGNIAWTIAYKSACVTGYADFDGNGSKENQAGVTYLVGPSINLASVSAAYIKLSQAINYGKETVADDHKLLIATTYSGNPATTSWTELPMSVEGLGSSFTFVEQNIQIPEAFVGKEVYLAFKHTAHEDYSSTWEVKEIHVISGTAPAAGEPGEIEGAVGSGTVEDPYNVATTIQLITTAAPSAKIYTKGKVSKVDATSYNAQYGSLVYYISDDGTETYQLEVYRGYGLKGEKFASASALKVGDDVVVYGQVVYYNNKTPEFTTGSQLYSLNGETEGGETPDPEPSQDTTPSISLSEFTNGGFETWQNGKPAQWISATTASSSNALEQSTDARNGSYSVKISGSSSSNTRLATTEIKLEAGEYEVNFYAKPEADGGSVRPGYVPVNNGSVGSYVYGSYTNDMNAGEWTQVTYTFTLNAETIVNLVIMNPKQPGKSILIDDYSITKK